MEPNPQESVTRDMVIRAFHELLGRHPGDERAVDWYLKVTPTRQRLYDSIRSSDEYALRQANPELFREAGQPAALKVLHSLDELDALMARAQAAGSEAARVAMLSDYVLADLGQRMPDDPFSPEYRQAVLEFYYRVKRSDSYDPATDERLAFDPVARARRPSIYEHNAHFLGSFLEAIGQILQVANVGPGARVIEYGAGDGQIALALARMGCDVTVLDIEPRYLESIRLQAQMLGVSIQTLQAEFMAPVPGPVDLVIFFEAFHHALDHQQLLRQLHDVVAPGGRIIFAGEPIIPADSFYRHATPVPWCLRLDALSLSATRALGWLELGFQEGYFLQLLRHTGWKPSREVSRTNIRGTCYVASH